MQSIFLDYEYRSFNPYKGWYDWISGFRIVLVVGVNNDETGLKFWVEASLLEGKVLLEEKNISLF